MKKIGLLLGVFDPPHLGHTAAAGAAMAQASLDEVWFVPVISSDFVQIHATWEQRAAMAKLSLPEEQGFFVCSRVFAERLADPAGFGTYLRANLSECRFVWIIGAEKIATLTNLNGIPQMLSAFGVLIYRVPGFDETMLRGFMESLGIPAKLVAHTDEGISSLQPRARLQQLDDAAGLIAPETAQYCALNGVYFPPFQRRLKKVLNPRRYQHTLGVRDTAVRLARIHGIDMQKAAVAALLHDCAKCRSLGELRAIAVEQHLTENAAILSSGALLHGMVGAYLAKAEYGVQDEGILDAIRYHTMGRIHMSGLDKCIFVADSIEPGRTPFEGLNLIRETAEKDLTAASYLCMQATKRYVLSMGGGYFEEADLAMEALKEESQRRNDLG